MTKRQLDFMIDLIELRPIYTVDEEDTLSDLILRGFIERFKIKLTDKIEVDYQLTFKGAEFLLYNYPETIKKLAIN